MEHPYLPEDLVIEGLQPIVISQQKILGVFFTACGVGLLLLVPFLRAVRNLSWGDTILCCWLTLSGMIHVFTEGPYVWNPNFHLDPPGDFMNELWKEYSKADSNYLLRDHCTVGIETLAACVEGPLCLLMAIAVMQKWTWRHVPIVVVSIAELTGTLLYFLTSYYEGFEHQRKEWIYFWFYFVIMNSIWIACPAMAVWKVTTEVHEAVAFSEKHKSAAVPSSEGFNQC